MPDQPFNLISRTPVTPHTFEYTDTDGLDCSPNTHFDYVLDLVNRALAGIYVGEKQRGRYEDAERRDLLLCQGSDVPPPPTLASSSSAHPLLGLQTGWKVPAPDGCPINTRVLTHVI